MYIRNWKRPVENVRIPVWYSCEMARMKDTESLCGSPRLENVGLRLRLQAQKSDSDSDLLCEIMIVYLRMNWEKL